MKKLHLSPEYSMHFEHTMMLLMGDKAYHHASYAGNETFVRKYLRQAIRRLLGDVNRLDTTERHKSMLVLNLEGIDKVLKDGGNVWDILFSFFNLTARFLGYDYHKAQKLITPSYHQTQSQHFWASLYAGQEWPEYEKQKSTYVVKRLKLIKQLKKDGCSDFEISLIFNTSEYHIKKILRESTKSK